MFSSSASRLSSRSPLVIRSYSVSSCSSSSSLVPFSRSSFDSPSWSISSLYSSSSSSSSSTLSSSDLTRLFQLCSLHPPPPSSSSHLSILTGLQSIISWFSFLQTLSPVVLSTVPPASSPLEFLPPDSPDRILRVNRSPPEVQDKQKILCNSPYVFRDYFVVPKSAGQEE
jgi:hypothetical protein